MKITIDRRQLLDLLALAGRSTGKTVVELVPGNGIARVQEMKEVQA